MELYPKFIIEGENLIISKVQYHKHIVDNKNNVKGGGWFKWSTDKNMIIFYGESHDFGAASFEDIKNCVLNGNVFTNKMLTHSIVEKHKFGYNNGSEIIEIK